MEVVAQDWISRWALYSPDKTAVREYESGRSYTYAQLQQIGTHMAHRLTREFGLQKGERIAIVAENCLEYFLLFSVAQKTGCILVPLNYRLASPEFDYLLHDCQPLILIAEATYLHSLQQAPAYAQVPHHWQLEHLRAFCEQALAMPAPAPFPLMPVLEDDPIFILYTSGTTGFPKGAIYTHKMLFWNSINTALSLVLNSESRTVNCMPPFHTGGWNVLCTPLLHHGGYTCLMKKFNALSVLQILQNERVSIFMGVPTMLRMIAELPEFERSQFPELLYILVGGEPMPIPLIERWHERGVPIRQGYGMTEVGPNLSSLHQHDALRKKGSIGRPNFYVEIQVVNPEGVPVPAGQAGELLLRGPMCTPGYWRNPEATKSSIRNGWFHSGDLVRQDEDGYLFVVDRIKNMYISGGENVYPAEVERVLLAHPAVQEAAVVPIPDPKWGESGLACLVLHPRHTCTEAELEAHCLQHLARFKVPSKFHILAELPKNDTGKIDRKRLL